MSLTRENRKKIERREEKLNLEVKTKTKGKKWEWRIVQL